MGTKGKSGEKAKGEREWGRERETAEAGSG